MDSVTRHAKSDSFPAVPVVRRALRFPLWDWIPRKTPKALKQKNLNRRSFTSRGSDDTSPFPFFSCPLVSFVDSSPPYCRTAHVPPCATRDPRHLYGPHDGTPSPNYVLPVGQFVTIDLLKTVVGVGGVLRPRQLLHHLMQELPGSFSVAQGIPVHVHQARRNEGSVLW